MTAVRVPRSRYRTIELWAARRPESGRLSAALRLGVQPPNLALPTLAFPVATHDEHHQPHQEGAAEHAAKQQEHALILRGNVVMNQLVAGLSGGLPPSPSLEESRATSLAGIGRRAFGRV